MADGMGKKLVDIRELLEIIALKLTGEDGIAGERLDAYFDAWVADE